ncbi:MAG: hypothetical protein Q9219_004683 [cf. Caloplaca sp. 3 TL-2023]
MAALTAACQQAVDRLSPDACPFCDEWTTKLVEVNPSVPPAQPVVTIQWFEHHVGSHMEQLALFAVPRSYDLGKASGNAAARYVGHRESAVGSQPLYEPQDDPPSHTAAFTGLKTDVLQLLETGAEVVSHGETWGNVLTAAIVGVILRLLRYCWNMAPIPIGTQDLMAFR